MLVTTAGRRFLIDAPIRESLAPYATSSPAERASLEGARAPYADVDAILITHWHEDHFSAEAVAAHLSSNPRTILVSSPEIVDRVRGVAPALAASRLRAVLPAPGQSQRVDVGGTPVRVLRIRHNPTRRPPEQHLGFLIGDSAPVLHVGDADPTADNFALLRSLPPVDLAFLPFWYVATPATGGWWPMRSGRAASSRCTCRPRTLRRLPRRCARRTSGHGSRSCLDRPWPASADSGVSFVLEALLVCQGEGRARSLRAWPSSSARHPRSPGRSPRRRTDSRRA